MNLKKNNFNNLKNKELLEILNFEILLPQISTFIPTGEI
jgi:hypothetical protein